MEDAIVELIRKAVTDLPPDVVKKLEEARKREEGVARTQIEAILENIRLAREEAKPICQDTGIQTFYVDVGADFPYRGSIEKAIVGAVRRATAEVPLRPNCIDVLTGKNSGDNTGDYVPYINWRLCDGSDAVIWALPKGGGSENMCALGMLRPGLGVGGIKKFVVDHVMWAGARPCPPIIVGLGLGGGADLSLKIAKRALLRPLNSRHPRPEIARLERELLDAINATGIGPMGLGGKTTALEVVIECAHRHPASLPVGIVTQCWADRRAKVTIHADGSYVLEGE